MDLVEQKLYMRYISMIIKASNMRKEIRLNRITKGQKPQCGQSWCVRSEAWVNCVIGHSLETFS